ncbi:hypothetical protein LVO79_20980 (plasmid) [Roseivivax marinus]|uniref:hypothetical protein n=1 Tax=Roseivivax marinus TaxID=1379903 RepID=UPI001F03BE6D|nr:hypothetical protein [Roseivivax marinus]UMA67257.1 hypothetical protein LVO79_20980 [Roseivivax marinus]
MLTQDDIDPLLELVSDIYSLRMGSCFALDENDAPVPSAADPGDLSLQLLGLHLRGRAVYDALAAKIEGARTYDDFIMESVEAARSRDKPDETT